MGIASSIVSAILKSVAGDKFERGLAKDFIGISIDVISEKGINEINDFIKGGKSKIDNILSKENMKSVYICEDNIDYVIAEVKHLFYWLDITDEVVRQCRYNSVRLEKFMWDKYVKNKVAFSHIEHEHENEIKKCLNIVAKEMTGIICESEKFSQSILIQISNSIYDVDDKVVNISEHFEKLHYELYNNNQAILNIVKIILEQVQKINIQTIQKVKFENNKKQDYINKWNKRLFLHMDNDEKPITLAGAFIVPHYKIYKKIERMNFKIYDTLEQVIEKFMKYDKTSTMLITGVPGIGKSSIVSWISDIYKYDNIIVLRFRDWDREELEKGLLNSVCSTLSCNKKDLNNWVLIIDGFDEIKYLDKKDYLLDVFLNDIKDFENFKLIITSRQPYIASYNFQNHIDILEFDITQVEIFYELIKGEELSNKDKIEQYLSVLGVPVILYMALMSNIDIKENPTKPELYNHIFAKEGGIFDKFSYDGTEYDIGNQVMRHPINIEKYLTFMQKVAFMMFEKNEICLVKDKDNYEVPELDIDKNKISILEFPIKHIFDKINAKIEFIHKSIYEYFVAEYIFTSMSNMLDNSTRKLAGILGQILKSNVLSCEILEFLQYKILQEANNKFNIVYETFQMMMKDGMTYYTKKYYKNVIECEMKVFTNMLEVIHLWELENYLELDDSLLIYMNDNINLKKINLKGQQLEGITVKKINLESAQLCWAKINNSILEEANLHKANLEMATITHVNLSNAIITEAVLRRAEFKKVDLTNADLRNTDFREVILSDFDIFGANLDNSIWHIDDLRKIYAQLYNTQFTCIIITTTYNQKVVSRNDYLSKKDFDDFMNWLYDELGI